MRYSDSSIYDLAESLNKKYRTKYQNDSSATALNVREMVQVLGGEIKEVPFLDIGGNTMSVNAEECVRDKSTGKWKSLKFTIYVSSSDSPRRQNFTIAHELGHLYLHFLKWNDDSSRRTSFMRLSYAMGGLIEREANMFAGALLMPKSEYERVYIEYEGDLVEIANIFDVSVSAAEVRASVLKLDKAS